jgi:AraC family transcriptional regulator, regulatory protein of adaptative response / methylated-DNA-[protein]-cysteine methyltransferase
MTHAVDMTHAVESSEARWQAVLDHDRHADGQFVYAVKTTGVYCRPSCPSRRPRRESVEFFAGSPEAERAGYRSCLRCRPNQTDPQTAWLAQCCRILEESPDRNVSLGELARQAGVSVFHLQRTFRDRLGVSPREYQEALRIQRVKQGLTNGASITEAIYDAGFGSSSRFYEKATEHLGMSPFTFKRRGSGQAIRYTVFRSMLGASLIATTDLGVCSIAFGDSGKELEQTLREQFSEALLMRDDDALGNHRAALESYLAGDRTSLGLPLNVRATAFQQRVWKLLASIPYGETRSYTDIAVAMGSPQAVRAVARACASNPVAIAVPCHRVLRKEGDLAGYRWGLERKQKLLENERRAAAK